MNFPKPHQGLSQFNAGDEVKRLGFTLPEESYYEVIEPNNDLVRSLVTGEESCLSGSYFLSLEDAELLPEQAIDLEEAEAGETYYHAHTGITYQVAQNQANSDTVNMINLESGDQSLFPRLGNAQFYKC
ncbi:hypothetical protein LNTAR_05011 [Lentisphaera araneosa HTCC2155]|uniref:Uncharacterized protein n=1 Tax=Lentisphaera araneosa HTCC2155 TaxID=313628 RepID=A6DLI9_9BACT|nr:hypothetical protein [Lentisphaera araneosa]EDM27444.1 hypothetical protein LNTAR_05011 [Lentisphaera araneosa HTCC2155]